MLAIRATYHDRQSETGVPAVFRIEGKRLLISRPDGNAIAAWKCKNVRMLSGPAQGQPLRICESGNSLVYLAPESAVNLSWLVSLCPKLGQGLAESAKRERRKPDLARATKSIIPQVAKVKGFGEKRRQLSSETEAAGKATRKPRKGQVFAALVILGSIGFALYEMWPIDFYKPQTVDHRRIPVVVSDEIRAMTNKDICNGVRFGHPEYKAEAERRGLKTDNCVPSVSRNRDSDMSRPVVITTKVRAMTDKDICAGVKFGHPEYVAEAFQRGLVAASCRRTDEGKPDVQRIPKDIRNMSAVGLCKNALRRQDNEYAWDGRTPVAKYVLEAKQRGYSVDDCFRIIDPDTIKPEIAAKSNVVVCRNALKLGAAKPQWRIDGEAHEYVKVARDRGLTAAACTRVAIASSRAPVAAAPAAEKKTRATSKPDDRVCRMATLRDDKEIVWDERRAVKAFLDEARLRDLTLYKCARIIGWKPAAIPAISAIGKPDDHVCRMATVRDNGKIVWDERVALGNFVEEARSRGLSLATCAQIIDWKAVPRKKPDLISSGTTDQDVCLELRRGNISAIREAEKRGLTGKLCVHAADWHSAPVPNHALQPGLPSVDLCRSALVLRNGEARWDRSKYTYAYFLEAKKRGLEIADCRRLVE